MCASEYYLCAVCVFCVCVCVWAGCKCNWKMQQLQQTKITKVATKLRQKCGKMKWSNGQKYVQPIVSHPWACRRCIALKLSICFRSPGPAALLPLSPFLRLPNDIKLAANKSRQRLTELPCPMQDAASCVHGTRNIAVITTYKKFQQSSALSLPLSLPFSLSKYSYYIIALDCSFHFIAATAAALRSF